MKKVEIIIRREKVDAVKKKLYEMGATGIMLSNIAGYGQDDGYVQKYRGKEYTFQTVQKMKLETVVKNEQVGPIIQIVMDIARTGKHGDGRIYVYDVSEVIRIRTGERGTDALYQKYFFFHAT